MGSGSSQHAGTIPLPQLRGEIHWAHYAIQGKRESMEDAFLAESLGNEAVFGVFDGHYGKRAALYSSENLARVLKDQVSKKMDTVPEMLKNGFLNLDRQLLDKSRDENWHDGTTSLVAFLTLEEELKSEDENDPLKKKGAKKTPIQSGRPKWGRRLSESSVGSSTEEAVDESVLSADGRQKLSVYIANAGDCRAISMYGDGRVFQLSTDHNPLLPYERWRIFKAGGNVKFGRIDGKLSVSRGFGDRQFKEPKGLVSAMPEVVSFPVTKNLRFVILACDGVWGWLDNVQVARFVSRALRDGHRPETVCKDLVKYAFDKGSSDNISVVLLYFTFNDPNSTLHTPITATSPETPKNPLKSSKKHSHSLDDSSRKGAHHADAGSSSPPTSLDIPMHKASKGATPILSPSESPRNSRSAVPLTASAKGKKFNYAATANATRWPLDAELFQIRSLRGTIITTHIATGESSYLDQSDFDSTTSEIEALTLDSRTAQTDIRGFSAHPSTRLEKHHEASSSGNDDLSSSEASPRSSPAPSGQDLENSPQLKKANFPSGRKSETSPALMSTAPTASNSAIVSSNQRRARVALPDEDEDQLATPKTRAAQRHRKANSDGSGLSTPPVSKRDVNYGLSDSESSEEIEAEMRRRSFDQPLSPARNTSSSSKHSKTPGKAESAETPSRKKSYSALGEPTKTKKLASSDPKTVITSSQPSQSPISPGASKTKKRSVLPHYDESDADGPAIRRAASFDVSRTEKSKKKKSK